VPMPFAPKSQRKNPSKATNIPSWLGEDGPSPGLIDCPRCPKIYHPGERRFLDLAQLCQAFLG
jgi:hypothetical protein